MRVFFSNLGCKLNQAEIERAARQFTRAGHRVVGSLEEADLHVVNTCTVTHVAARSSRKVARRSKRQSPDVKTVLTGCWVAESPSEAESLPGVDLVVGNHEKDRLVQRVHERFPDTRPEQVQEDLLYHPLTWGHQRAAVKIEDGCNVNCAFCIIPTTRGSQRSLPPDEILHEIRGLVHSGFSEIVLTGVQISHYRSGGMGLWGLTQRILDETELRRLRLTSIAPWRFDRRILHHFESGRLCRHFHLSLQSGCSQTLRRMKRPYSAEAYEDLVSELKSEVPGLAITTDVIAGFPGETEQEFESSLAFVARQGFAKVHAFPYSSRPGTVAASLGGQLSPQVKQERMQRLLEVARWSEVRFWQQNLEARLRILWERERVLEDGRRSWSGTTDNYIHVVASDSNVPSGVAAGQLQWAQLERIEEGRVHARWCSDEVSNLGLMKAGSL